MSRAENLPGLLLDWCRLEPQSRQAGRVEPTVQLLPIAAHPNRAVLGRDAEGLDGWRRGPRPIGWPAPVAGGPESGVRAAASVANHTEGCGNVSHGPGRAADLLGQTRPNVAASSIGVVDWWLVGGGTGLSRAWRRIQAGRVRCCSCLTVEGLERVRILLECAQSAIIVVSC